MSKQRSDWEDSLKLLVPQKVLDARKTACNKCKLKGPNGFCQENAEWLEEFQKYRYNKCPKGTWSDGWHL